MSTQLIFKPKNNNVNYTEFSYPKNIIDLNINTTATSNFSLSHLNNSEISFLNKKKDYINKNIYKNLNLNDISDNTINTINYIDKNINNIENTNIYNNNYNNNYNNDLINTRKKFNSFICCQHNRIPIETKKKMFSVGNFLEKKKENTSFLFKNKTTTNLLKKNNFRTDRNGTTINKTNKKKVKVTFIDEIENKPLVQIIDIQNLKQINYLINEILNGKEVYKKRKVTCCSCLIF